MNDQITTCRFCGSHISGDTFPEEFESSIDDIIEIVQRGSGCERHDVSPETWLEVKAVFFKLLTSTRFEGTK